MKILPYSKRDVGIGFVGIVIMVAFLFIDLVVGMPEDVRICGGLFGLVLTVKGLMFPMLLRGKREKMSVTVKPGYAECTVCCESFSCEDDAACVQWATDHVCEPVPNDYE